MLILSVTETKTHNLSFDFSVCLLEVLIVAL